MARKKRSRGFQPIQFDEQVALATLADDTVLSDPLFTFGEDMFLISVDAIWQLRNLTAGEGPIIVGWSHGDLSVAEILEALEANLTDPDDIIAKERSRRPVRKAGAFDGLGGDLVLNDGKPIRTKLRFSVGDAHALRFWALNRSATTNLTTGSVLRVSGTLYGRWQR